MIKNKDLIQLLNNDFSNLNLTIKTIDDTIYAYCGMMVSKCDFLGLYEIYMNKTGFISISLTIKAKLGIKKIEYEQALKRLQEKEKTSGTFTINEDDELTLVWLDEHNETLDEFKNYISYSLKEIKNLNLQ